MTTPDYDLIIAGGGIHGVGVAQAAGAAGYRSLVVEARELAWGTSSRSSKLIHGGLRYLETFQLSLVRESLRERQILLTVAPGLVRLVPFHIPIYPETTRRPWKGWNPTICPIVRLRLQQPLFVSPRLRGNDARNTSFAMGHPSRRTRGRGNTLRS